MVFKVLGLEEITWKMRAGGRENKFEQGAWSLPAFTAHEAEEDPAWKGQPVK